MDNNSGTNKDLICINNRLIIHIIIFALLSASHIIIIFKVHWMKDLIKFSFIYTSFIGVVYISISIIPLILIKIKKLQPRVNFFKILSKILFFFSFFIGLFFTIIIIINKYLFDNFCIECPFNLSFSYFESHFEEKFEDKEEDELKGNCKERRCIFNNKIEKFSYPYHYLCNYNSEEEFQEKPGKDKEIKCISFYRNPSLVNEIIYKYFEKCYNFTNFYYCGRKQEPKEYVLEEEEKCPQKNYIYTMYFLCAYIFIFDLILNLILWYLQVNSYYLLSRINFEAVNTININNNINNNNQYASTNNNNNGQNNEQRNNEIIPNNEDNTNQRENTIENNNEHGTDLNPQTEINKSVSSLNLNINRYNKKLKNRIDIRNISINNENASNSFRPINIMITKSCLVQKKNYFYNKYNI